MKVGHTDFITILKDNQLALSTYWKWMCKSYTDENPNVQFCPERGCDYVFEREETCGTQFVMCKCGVEFCFNCPETAHRPLDCKLTKEWADKAIAESENTVWIMAFTKPCPVCKVRINKNQGCN